MAESILNRRKTSAAVVEFLLEALFEGRMSSGERVDIDEVAAKLGVSRSPVREALVILERDGIVSNHYHRGVYVEQFDTDSIIDNFEVYGTLSGLAVARLARRPDADLIAQMKQMVSRLNACEDPDRMDLLVQDLVRLQHRASGSRRLRAELRSFAGFLPWVFRVAGGRSHDRAVKGQARVVRAIAAGDPEGAARARAQDFTKAGREVAAELTRRGVFHEQRHRTDPPEEGV
jgi:DNA-binding GntR family transcriptional regulator